VEIRLRDNPTYIHDDGRVEIHCYVDGEEHRIFMSMEEYMVFVADQVNALTHHLTGRTNPHIR